MEELHLPSVFPAIFDPEPIEDIVRLHCVLFTIQYACAMSWLDCGLIVDRLIGHSFGQLTGLCVAGSITLPDALRLVAERAHLIRQHCSSKTSLMLAVDGTQDDVDALLCQAEQQCRMFSADIACYNGTRSFVIAGDLTSIHAIEAASAALANPVRMKRLDNSHAFHSRLLDGIIPGLLRAVEGIQFSAPQIPIEACSDDDWSDIDGEKIVRHTRMAVRFQDAVRRIERQVAEPLIWLEAGSGSPIVPMVKRAVQPSQGSSARHHVYIPTSLRGQDAQNNLAKAVSRLWSQGVKVQFWMFHGLQSSSYSWINLPPYQFAKTRHWLDYKPAMEVWETLKPDSLSSAIDLVRLLPANSRTQQGETLFEINTKHTLYQLHTSGHEVVEQALCPASLYIEFVLMATHLLSESSIALVPRIKDLAMVSPLVLDPNNRILLRLMECKDPINSWSFTIFGQNDTKNSDSSSVTHGSGIVSMLECATSSTIGNLQSMSSLMLRRCSDIETSADSIGFKGSTVYHAMYPAVTYVDYFHGIQSFYTSGDEATASVAMPAARPGNMGSSFCDPVLTDSFAQVAGVLANCFCIDQVGEMWICNFMGDVQYTKEFVDTGRNKQSWIVYSKYTRPLPKKLQCDVFVFDPQSKNLVLIMMACSFQKASVKSLKRVLAKLNGQPVATMSAPAEAQFENVPVARPIDNIKPLPMAATLSTSLSTKQTSDGTTITAPTAQQSTQQGIPKTVATRSESGPDTLQKVQKMLSDVLEISLGEVSPAALLADLGVDSLLATELFTEIRQRFNVTVAHSQFATILDVQGLALLVSGSSPQADDLAHQIVHNSSAPALEMETVTYGYGDGVPLSADIYYPYETNRQHEGPRPIGESMFFLFF